MTDWKKCNQDEFKAAVALAPWHTCDLFDDIDDNYWMVETLYKNIKVDFLPQRKVKVRSRKSLPWVNGAIRKLMVQFLL